MKRFIAKTLSVAICSLYLNQFAIAADLKAAWQHSLQHDPTYLASQQSWYAGQEKAEQASALWKPRLSLSAYSNHIDSESELPASFAAMIPLESSGTETGYKLQLSQPLYRADNWANSKQLKQQTELANIQWQASQQNQILRVSNAYFSVLLAEQQLQLLEAQLNATTEQLADATARFNAGRAKITDVRDAGARYASIKAALISATSELAIRRQQFELLTGLPASNLTPVRRDFAPSAPEPLTISDWQQRATDNNLNVQQRQVQLNIANAEVNKQALYSKPTLDLVASYNKSRSSGDLSPLVSPEEASSKVIGVQLTVPLYAGGSLRSQSREAESKQREASQWLDAARLDAKSQAQEAYLAVYNGAARVNALEQSNHAAKTALEAAVLGKQVGVKTTQDVLNAQQHFYSAQFVLAQARYAYLNGRLQLQAVTGALTEQELNRINGELAF